MRIGNMSGRLTLFTDAGAVDVEKAPRGSIRGGSESQRTSCAIVKTGRCSRVWEVGGDQGAARRTEAVDAVGPVVADVSSIRVGDLVHDDHGPPLSCGLETVASGLNWARNPRTGQEPCSNQAIHLWACRD